MSDVIVKCKCGKEFKTKDYRIKDGRGKYCSVQCRRNNMPTGPRGKYVKHKENPTSFKKGFTPWNAGLKGTGICKATSGSMKKGERRGIATEFKKGETLNEKNNKWKGDNVKYEALHTYIHRRLGKANHCEFCKTTTSTLYVWHNKDGQYRRNLNDWISLCHKCHMQLHHKIKMKYRIKYASR